MENDTPTIPQSLLLSCFLLIFLWSAWYKGIIQVYFLYTCGHFEMGDYLS